MGRGYGARHVLWANNHPWLYNRGRSQARSVSRGRGKSRKPNSGPPERQKHNQAPANVFFFPPRMSVPHLILFLLLIFLHPLPLLLLSLKEILLQLPFKRRGPHGLNWQKV
ncbi:hypothetical protein FRX31_021006 [Thalictrum thalictroides]|uniref:Uncharacterized protein n=1 Tax=Thalictrum thalictroides TaxID=46969 RepID=A0A7J6VWC2_THATH|nr:hypothetical protein FRX31_021006 [Thalictrum thalictroides]